MPKIKRPAKGWWRPEKYKKIFRKGPKVESSEKGLPPCPSCGEWSMQRDGTRNELFCGICGAVL
ncbi:MAG: hypothetical protein VX660_03340 [Candidatus Thermoplasmatota archaeon]|nr:hypothetical protein [Candidatus Thermoplasmatota archaeon]MEC9146747.1 hypothetical protein [Candidatus Thermoplasmatota archaeon]MEC9200825.1 hypothetical protein [Candidatus Thermoplasmatota archaeon]MEE2625615.1 hypothetical protein [Candidatus Thermoplasmatota archaeon]